MTQTPEERARSVLIGWGSGSLDSLVRAIAAAIRAAVAAETERCARIVDPTRGCTAAVLSARTALAAAIREAPAGGMHEP